MFRAAIPVFLSFCFVDIPIPPQEPEPAPLIWRGGGATLGIQAVGEQAVDFGGSCRHCLPELKEDKLSLRLNLVAWDALAVVVHPDNPIQSISRKQPEQILKQEITDWSELGLPAPPIAVITREGKTSESGARPAN